MKIKHLDNWQEVGDNIWDFYDINDYIAKRIDLYTLTRTNKLRMIAEKYGNEFKLANLQAIIDNVETDVMLKANPQERIYEN